MSARFSHTASMLRDEKVLLIGGNNGTALKSSELYWNVDIIELPSLHCFDPSDRLLLYYTR